jgi:hypothetical protein
MKEFACRGKCLIFYTSIASALWISFFQRVNDRKQPLQFGLFYNRSVFGGYNVLADDQSTVIVAWMRLRGVTVYLQVADGYQMAREVAKFEWKLLGCTL